MRKKKEKTSSQEPTSLNKWQSVSEGLQKKMPFKSKYLLKYKKRLPRTDLPEAVFRRQREAYEKARRREQLKADDPSFRFNGMDLNRYQMMELVIRLTYEGYSLPSIMDDVPCEDDVFPIPGEVMAWMEMHPDFEAAYKRAEKYRAECLADESLKIVRAAKDQKTPAGMIDKNFVSYAKLASDTCLQQASFLSEKFQTKTQVKQETKVSELPEDQAKSQLAKLLSDPDLKKLFSEIIEVDAIGMLGE